MNISSGSGENWRKREYDSSEMSRGLDEACGYAIGSGRAVPYRLPPSAPDSIRINGPVNGVYDIHIGSGAFHIFGMDMLGRSMVKYSHLLKGASSWISLQSI